MESEEECFHGTPESNCVYIVDAMAFIQRHQNCGCKTFADLQALYREKLIKKCPKHCHTIHFVGDRYEFPPTVSLKQDTRQKRTSGRQEREYEVNSRTDIPDWKMFMANIRNKANLLNFIGESWITEHKIIPKDIQLIVGGVFRDPGRTVAITSTYYQELPDLSCNEHEEADTRMFAHLNYSVRKENCTTGVICCTDTDVIVLAMYYYVHMPGLKETWIHKNNIYLPLHRIVNDYAESLCCETKILTSVLLNTYILTGCDTVSFIFNKTKARALKLVAQNIDHLKTFATYGETSETGIEEAIEEACYFFKCMYGRPDFAGSLDMLRAHLFATSDSDLRFLPPTTDAFRQHVLRTLMQVLVSKSSHLSNPAYPDPTKFGRHIVNGRLVPVLMHKSAKPVAAQKVVGCKCKQGRCLRGCGCTNRNGPCTVSCLCGGDPSRCGRAEKYLTIQDASSDED